MNDFLKPIFHLKIKGLFLIQDVFKYRNFVSEPNLYDKNTFLWLKISESSLHKVVHYLSSYSRLLT